MESTKLAAEKKESNGWTSVKMSIKCLLLNNYKKTLFLKLDKSKKAYLSQSNTQLSVLRNKNLHNFNNF
jgi:hypothetical protein